jgi:PAS domain S-box-containing protein
VDKDQKKELSAQLKYNEVRAKIWELAADKALGEKELIQNLLNIIGPAMEVSRAAFLRYHPEKKEFVGEITWNQPHIESSLGVTISYTLGKFFFGREIVELPKEMLPVVREVVRAKMKKHGVLSWLAIPFSMDEKKEPKRIMTFSDCERKRAWSNMEKRVLLEAIKIVSTRVEQIKAEKELDNYKNRLEEQVEERTVKLKKEIAERKQIEQGLAEQIKYNNLRAYIWEIASDKSYSENQLLQRLFNAIGPVVDANRVYYCKINQMANLFCVAGWAKKGITPIKGEVNTGTIPDTILSEEYFEFENENLEVEKIPESFRSVVKPILNTFLPFHDTESIILVPFKVHDNIEGIIAYEFPKEVKEKTFWQKYKREIILEMIHIISRTFDQKRIEHDLKTSEERLNIIFESAPDAMYLNDSKGIFLNGNKAAEDLTGYKREDLIGKNIFSLNLLSKKSILRAGKLLALNLMGKPTGPDEFVLNKKDGQHVDVEIRTYPVKINNRLVVLGIARDITQRKKSMEELRESEEKFRVLAETSSDGIFTTDGDGKFTYINPALEKLFDVTSEKAMGLHFSKYITKTDSGKGIKVLWDLTRIKSDAVRNTEFIAVREDGQTFPIEISASPIIKEKNFMGIECIVRDITERKVAEEEKTKLESLLNQSQKMEAIGTLAGGIAHDFNNILGVILGFSELALDNLAKDHPARKDIKNVYDSGMRARDLVKQILTFSRRTEIEHKPLQVAPIVKETLKFLRSSFPTTIKIKPTIDQDLDYINADPSQIQQIVMNLCTNSLHAMEETGGTLEVRVFEKHLSQKSPETKNLEPGSYILLEVTDTGEGMNKKTLNRIFEPFFTTKAVGKGTGMGLSVVHGIIESFKGAITVQSEPGKGTTFKVYFPVSSKDQIEKKIVEESKIPTGNESILVVEDEEPLAEMYGLMLERWGYKATVKTSALDALETFKEDPHAFDLVVTDQTMPEMLGTWLSRELIKIRPDIPVILNSGYGDIISKEELSSSGIKIRYTKPISNKEFAKGVREALDRKSP